MSQESVQTQEEEEIKSVEEQWRLSEMQVLEPLPEASSDNNNSRNPETELWEHPPEMENNGAPPPPPPEPKKPEIHGVAFKELFRFADGLDYALMAIGSVGAFVHGCSLPLFLRFFADLVNSFGSNANNVDKMMQEVLKYALYFLVVGAAIWASSWAEISCWMWTGERQTTKMRIKYLEAALNQDIQFFDTEVRTSDVVSAINTDAVMVQDAISEKLGNFIHYMATFASGFIVGFTAVWQLALVTLAVVPLIAVIGGIHTTTLSKLSNKSQESLSQAGNIVEQTVVQIRVVMAFVGETRASQAYSSALKTAQRLGYKTGLAKGMGLGATYFVVFCCYALLLWYGGYLVRHRLTNGGLAISTMFAVMIGGLALGQSAPSMAAFAKAKVAAAKIFRIIDHRPTIERNSESGVELDSVTGLVELRNVDFSYPSRPDVKILNDFNLSVPAGKTIALVGSSGSGKSTVVSLIERFYDPASGQVLLDGHDLKTLKLKWLRQQIGLVSQEPALFATSIRENILLGRPDADQVEIEEAARVANAHSFIIKLPDGFDTQVGERGLQLSGGQKQRIAIARAMLKNPAILLLDEATSALDSESEKLVQEALDRFMIGRTTLIIAHRLSTIRKADLVAVLQQGSVSEIGTHDELFAKGENGVYSKLIKMQEAAHETAMNNARKSSARQSSARNSVSSPIMTRNSSYGRSPYSRRLSDFSTTDFTLSIDASSYPNYRHDKLPFKDQANSFLRLAKMNSPEWKYALLGSIGSVICGSLSAFFAYVLSAVLSIYYNPNHEYMIKQIGKYCYLLIGLSSTALIFNTLQHSFWDIVGENLTKRVREKMFTAVLKNEMAWFDQEENESARISARLALDANNVRSAIGDRISVIVQNTALMLVACTAGFVLQWRLALVLVAVFPVVVAATVLQKMFMTGFSGDLEAAHAKGTQLAGEAIANVRTVAAFNSEAKIVRLYTANLEPPLKRCFWKGQIAGIGYGIAQFCLYASYALGLWYASWLVKHGISDFSKTIRVFMVLMVSANGAAETLTLAPDFIKGGQAMWSVFELLDRKTEIEPDDPDTTPVPDRLRGEVELKHIDFSYPSRPDIQVFRDLTLRARAGKTLALVGPSGCGKSSVISLVQRFYEPSSGRVMIDGKDIRKYNLKALRKHIAIMASSSLPLSLPFPLRSRSSTRALTFRRSRLFLSLPTSIVCLSTQNPSGEESRWLREEQRWLREEQRWLREEQRWIRERETLLQEIADLQLRIQTLESRNPDTISNLAALLQVLKEKNRISESGSSAKPMVLENTREVEEEEEEEEEVVVVEKQVVAEEKVKVSEPVKRKRVTLKVGSEGEEVQAMQEALLKLGFYSGEEDMEFSSFSSGTARAVKTWQSSLGVREDGVMTEELLQMLFMDQVINEDVKTEKVETSTMKQETKEAGNGAVKTQQSIIKDQGNRGNEVSQHRVFLLGENRWEDPSRLNKASKSTDTRRKCITCRGEGRLMCLECDGTGEPNIEPQFMELVDEDAKCVYCEGLGYTVCDVCEGKTAV